MKEGKGIKRWLAKLSRSGGAMRILKSWGPWPRRINSVSGVIKACLRMLIGLGGGDVEYPAGL